ncbi:uncharacterized protein LOC128296662 [Gossypium arboreum]|uniref:uncharacterized protein LOC128296662 n=1 Tax=Gossypium arboreum TaxID=29729 RepID=UPI0022F1DB2C|nr:uncharacterized protein LOC128296662 [Gossypium arboreum]
MQEQLQEQLAKIQQEMKDQMLEAQRNMMAEIAQLLKGATDKGKALMTITEEDNEDHHPGFTPPHVQTQPEAYPRRLSIRIRPQHGQVDAGIPMNFQTSLGFNPGNNPTNPIIPDLDVAEKEEMILESSRQLEERCKWLEEKFKNMEKKPNESCKQYAQRWREAAMQVQPPLLEKETTMLFINTLKAPFITHMIGSTTKSFADIVMA